MGEHLIWWVVEGISLAGYTTAATAVLTWGFTRSLKAHGPRLFHGRMYLVGGYCLLILTLIITFVRTIAAGCGCSVGSSPSTMGSSNDLIGFAVSASYLLGCAAIIVGVNWHRLERQE